MTYGILVRRILGAAGVTVYSVTEGEVTTPTMRMIESVLEMRDRFYSDSLAESVREGMQAREDMDLA